MDKRYLLFMPFAFLMSSVDAQEMALVASLGNLGFGLEAHLTVNEQVKLRTSAELLSLTQDSTVDDINYQSDTQINSYGLLADYYPFKNRGLRTSIGFVGHYGSEDLQAVCQNYCLIGKNWYKSSKINQGQLLAEIDHQRINPYLGVGWVYFLKDKQSFWSVDLGWLINTKQTVNLNASGDFDQYFGAKVSSQQTSFQTDLQLEQQNIQKDLDESSNQVVLKFGLGYKF